MGLDTTHEAWHGAYSAFTRFRNELAKVAGYEVKPQRYQDGMTFDTAQIDWSGIELVNPACYAGEWNEPAADPLFYLLAHSDCDGVIHPEQAGPLADRLEELLPRLTGDGGGHIGNYREKTKLFIDGLRRAVDAGEDVEFH